MWTTPILNFTVPDSDRMLADLQRYVSATKNRDKGLQRSNKR